MPEGLLPPVIAELRANTTEFHAKMREARAELETMGDSSKIEQMAARGKAAFMGLAVAGVALGAVALKMADEFEAAHARLETAVKNVGASFEEEKGHVDALDKRMERFGYTNAQTESALAKLLPAVKEPTKAINEMALAADIARGRHMDLEAATQILVKVETGHVALLGRMGVNVKDANGQLISQEEAIKRLSAMYGGNASAYAETFAGKMQALKARSEDLAKNIGLALIPVLERMATILGAGASFLVQHHELLIALGVAIGSYVVPAMLLWLGIQTKVMATTVITNIGGMIRGVQALGFAYTEASAGLGTFAAGMGLLAAAALPIAAIAVEFKLMESRLHDNEKAAKSWASSFVQSVGGISEKTLPQIATEINQLNEVANRGWHQNIAGMQFFTDTTAKDAAQRRDALNDERKAWIANFQAQKQLAASGDGVAKLAVADMQAAEAAKKMTESEKELQKAIGSFGGPLAAYQAATTKAQDAAEAANKKGGKSFSDLRDTIKGSLRDTAQALEDQIKAEQNWQKNLVSIAARGGGDVVQTLAKMGKDGQDLAAQMVAGTSADFDRMHADLVKWAGLTNQDTTAEFTDMLGNLVGLGAKTGGGYVEALTKMLSSGTAKIASVVEGYAILMLNEANYVLIGVGGKQIPVQKSGELTTPFKGNYAEGGKIGGGFVTNKPTGVVGEGNPAFPEYALATDPAYRASNQRLWIDAGKKLQMLAGGGVLGGELPLPTPIGPGMLQRGGEATEKRMYDAVKAKLDAQTISGGGWRDITAFLDRSHVGYTVTSTTGGHHAPGSYHYLGKAVDLVGNMSLIFDTLLRAQKSLAELFFTPKGFSIKNSQRVAPIAAAEHYNHVHAAVYDGGGWLPPGISLAGNFTGRHEPVGAGAMTVNFTINAGAGTDVRALAKEIRREFTDMARSVPGGAAKLFVRSGG